MATHIQFLVFAYYGWRVWRIDGMYLLGLPLTIQWTSRLTLLSGMSPHIGRVG